MSTQGTAVEDSATAPADAVLWHPSISKAAATIGCSRQGLINAIGRGEVNTKPAGNRIMVEDASARAWKRRATNCSPEDAVAALVAAMPPMDAETKARIGHIIQAAPEPATERAS